MKKTLLATAIATQLFTQLHAGGHIEPIEVTEPEVLETEASESKFYIVAKGMMVLGDTVDEENSVLDGDKDYGFGIDVGYRLGNGFAVEYDFSYATNTVTETAGGEVRDASAKYYTSALDFVYTVEATENIGIFGKVGYEYEWEKIDAYDIDNTNHDFVFGVGTEIAMNEDYKLVVEYEHSLVEGPHGDSVFAGVMFNF